MNLDSMQPEALFQEASRLRKEIVSSAERLHHVCSLMYTKARRSTANDGTGPDYVIISNAGRRFAGSVVQGAKRTEAVDRVLLKTKRVAREDQERKEVKERREADSSRRVAAREQAPQDVYGIFESSNERGFLDQQLLSESELVDQLLSKSSVEADLNDLYGDE